jgi:putative transposase
MPNYRRSYIEGATYFFTVVTFGRRPFLISALAREALRTAFDHVRARMPFQTEAICLLPDHLHCLWTLPPNDAQYPKRWRTIKETFTKRYLAGGGRDGPRNASRRRTGEAAVWQRRFWEHRIRDERDFRRHLDYIHFNPVKHGHVAKAEDWPHSTFHRYVRLGWYEADWGSLEPDDLKGFSCEE